MNNSPSNNLQLLPLIESYHLNGQALLAAPGMGRLTR